MDVVDALNGDYGDIVPFGKGPDQQKIWEEANEYLHREFPKLDYFVECSIIPVGPVKLPPPVVKASSRVVEAAALPSRSPVTPSTLLFIVGAIFSSLLLIYKISDKKADKKSVV